LSPISTAGRTVRAKHYLDHRVGVANSRGSVSAFAAEAGLVGVMAVSSHPL
jgi:hypothetical protein